MRRGQQKNGEAQANSPSARLSLEFPQSWLKSYKVRPQEFTF
jgi:hypothetical protein